MFVLWSTHFFKNKNISPWIFNLSDDVTIPKGSEVILDIWGMHRNKHYWKFDATRFNPENFYPENAVPRSAYAYIPFSAGPRVCIGKRLNDFHVSQHQEKIYSILDVFPGKKYGIVAMKLLIVYIVRHYRLTTKLKLEDLKFQMQITLGMLNENVIEIENRNGYWKYVVCPFVGNKMK